MSLVTNKDRLVQQAVVGEISHPTLRKTGYVISSRGRVEVYPSVGGITYNCRIGDSAIHWEADHVEPGVSIRNSGPSFGEYSPNAALNVLACIGNKAVVISGEAKGAVGYVTGKHGGIDHVMVDFPPDVLEQLNIGDRIRVHAYGTGLKLRDYPSVTLMSIDPDLFEKLPIQEAGGKLRVGVTHIIPAKLMGAGLGNTSAYSGDYDIQLFDEAAIRKYRLDQLRFGDLVAIIDSDATFGWIFKEGAVTIGVIAHSNSVVSGHGPGVTTIMTTPEDIIEPYIDPDVNLKQLFYHQ
ncbi:MAG: DUF4438 domain-containing protein [Calditrichaeota bacterium]|nr:DUF4438 domain-containing protein [Calditrichota bacterium]